MTMFDDLAVLTTLRRARLDREEAERQEAAAVALARRAGWSWARIGRELNLLGETLRRHHGAGEKTAQGA